MIPRRPVGSHSNNLVQEHSLSASRSICSQPELDVPPTNTSQYSLESVQLNDDDDDHNNNNNNNNDDVAPQLPPKDPSPPVPSKDETLIPSRPPPIPPKDTARSQVDAATFRLADNNSQQPEIWKRRSERSNSDLSFGDLPLSNSNGSTASSPPRAQSPRALPPVPGNAPLIRKALPSPPPAELPDDAMGSKHSKPRAGASRPPGRLPTPEYLKTDKQIRIHTAHNFLAPKGPESPVSPSPFPKSPRKGRSNSIRRKAVPRSTSPAMAAAPHNRSVDSGLTFTDSERSSEGVTIVGPSDSTVFSAPQPQKANAAARILQPHSPAPPADEPPPPSPGDNWPLLAKSPFSDQAAALANAGLVRPGPPVDRSHYECYQGHRFMRPSPNALCPLACRACEKRDKEHRWSCTWCCLKICTACMEVLAASGKDLRVCMERLGKAGGGGGGDDGPEARGPRRSEDWWGQMVA